FMWESGVVSFGDFVTKSGRKTPFFINTGLYNTGSRIARLGAFYAKAIQSQVGVGSFDLLFGPAYKGIPLAVSIAASLFANHGVDKGFCFNRKESKDHGEGGHWVGKKPKDGDRVLIVEDVVTAGTAVRECVPMLKAAGEVELAGLVVSVDRMEKGKGQASALKELADEYGMPVVALVTLDEIMEHLETKKVDGKQLIDPALKAKINEYRRQYGAS
ncbi:MAG TPA: orotate phosphoribosyltransferase, partial [Bdellovibrionota bacterium]|nr:orotate phosphoribosyltransferase [Bdellovibrionota bacterium]